MRMGKIMKIMGIGKENKMVKILKIDQTSEVKIRKLITFF